MVKTQSIEALVQLLDDPDEAIFAHVRSKLIEAGNDVLPIVRNSIDIQSVSISTFERIDLLISELQFLGVKNELIDWITKPEKDLLRGALIIAKYQFPELDYRQIEEQIATIEQAVWLELNGKLTCFETVKTINKVLFDLYDFKGAELGNYSPYHSYLNTVLEEREGTPLSLSIIYSVIAQRLNIPIYGVAFPNHFIVAFMDEYKLHKLLNPTGSGGVLFYIDPYAKGELLSKENLEDALKRYDISPNRDHFEPTSHSAILLRMINNLIYSYSNSKRQDKIAELNELKACFIFD
jgi:regulator of sirC expression with transglutaminase-like and TPR domain